MLYNNRELELLEGVLCKDLPATSPSAAEATMAVVKRRWLRAAAFALTTELKKGVLGTFKDPVYLNVRT